MKIYTKSKVISTLNKVNREYGCQDMKIYPWIQYKKGNKFNLFIHRNFKQAKYLYF